MGEIPDEERMEIYAQDLRMYPIDQVIEALTWARLSLTHFPKIAELIQHIEGPADRHAEHAWRTLTRLVQQIHPRHSICLQDAILGQCILEQWGSWPAMATCFQGLQHPAQEHDMKKTFLQLYLERFRAAKQAPPLTNMLYLVGIDEYQARYDDTITAIEYYTIAADGRMTSATKVLRQTTEPPDPVVPMPPELKRKIRQLVHDLGGDHAAEPESGYLKVLPFPTGEADAV